MNDFMLCYYENKEYRYNIIILNKPCQYLWLLMSLLYQLHLVLVVYCVFFSSYWLIMFIEKRFFCNITLSVLAFQGTNIIWLYRCMTRGIAAKYYMNRNWLHELSGYITEHLFMKLIYAYLCNKIMLFTTFIKHIHTWYISVIYSVRLFWTLGRHNCCLFMSMIHSKKSPPCIHNNRLLTGGPT